MKKCLVILVVLSMASTSSLSGQPPAKPKMTAESHAARVHGWQLAQAIVKILEAGDQTDYPGIQAWLKDFQQVAKGIDPAAPSDQWPDIDADALVTHNGNFWRAYYEVAPGDPAIILLHASLLLSGGEADRANYLAVVVGQRQGAPAEFRQAFDTIVVHSNRLREKPQALLNEGTALHDKGDYAGAIQKYQAALDLWPQYGLAHYEMGLSLYYQDLIAAGKKPPAPNSLQVNSKDKPSAAVEAVYAKARQHDPFQLSAYQGQDPEAIRGLFALSKNAMPAWQKLLKNRNQPLPRRSR